VESTSTFTEGATLRGVAFKGGLRPAVAAMGASSPVGAVQSVTRVLERSDEEGSPLTRALCSGLSAHVDFAAQAARSVSAERDPTWLAAGCLGDLTTRQREAAYKAAFTGEDEPYVRRVRAS